MIMSKGRLLKSVADMAAELVKKKAVLPREEAEANLRRMLDQSKVQQRLYHGTTATEGGKGAEAIRRFKPSKEGALGSGSYLTPAPSYASGYADQAGGNILPVYAQIKNPLVIEGGGDPMVEALTKLGMDEDKASRMVERAYENKGYIGKEVESRARAAGYDGLMQYRDGELSEVVSYNPNAIKSAIGNEGTYDTSVPDLSKAEGGVVRKADGGIMDAIEAAKMAGKPRAAIPFNQTVDVEQMRREVEENARRVAQVKQDREQERLSRLPPAEMKAYDPSPRQQVGAAVQKGFSSLGAPISRARELSNVLTGGTTGGMSAIDVTPIGAAFLGQEGIERVAQNVGEGNYGTAALEAGLTALDVLPGSAAARAMMKPAASAASKSLKPATKSLEDLRYETAQEGPFYRVRPRGYEQSGYLPYGTKEAPGKGSGVVGRPEGSIVPKLIPDEQVDELISQPDNFVRQSVDQYSQEKFGRPYEMPQMPESSLLKQGPIGRVFELAATDNPQYKAAVFDAYAREMPDVVQQAGAKSYDELMARSYEQLAKETEDQFKLLPLNLSYHRAGEGDYDSSKDLLKDIYGNKHMYVYQGGDPHDFLNKVDPGTGLNTNEMFRAVHDFYGHALHGNQFGPKGEEIAWGAHSQTFSPLARLAMSSETRGQNSFVNYTPINAPLKKQIAEFDDEIAQSKRMGDKNSVDELQAEKKRLLKSAFQFAPQKSVLLPPEFLKLDYNGGMPDYLQTMIKPAPETATSMPLTHFSFDPNLSATDPSKFGEGAAGREVARLKGAKGAVGERTYFYPGEPGAVERETQVGPYRYRGEASSLYDVSKDPMNLGVLARESNRSPFASNVNPGMVYQGEAMTDLERLAKEYGYEGIFNPNVNPPMAMTYGSMPVQRQKNGGRVSMDAMRLAVGGSIAGEIAKKAAKALKPAEKADVRSTIPKILPEPKKASKAFEQFLGERVALTAPADRMVAIPGPGSKKGGPLFPWLSTVDPAYENVVWANKGKAAASKMINLQKEFPGVIFTPQIGSAQMHRSNQVVYDDIRKAFNKAVKEGKLTPELRDAYNERLTNQKFYFDEAGRPLFDEGFDVSTSNLFNEGDTFARRAALAEVLGGEGVGGKKGRIIDYDKIISKSTEPMLADAPTGSVGPRAFQISGDTSFRPDLHRAFPEMIHGADVGVHYEMTPRDVLMHDFVKRIEQSKGRKPGVMDWDRNKVIQEINRETLQRLEDAGYKKGGQVKRMAEGGQITSDDLIIEERKL